MPNTSAMLAIKAFRIDIPTPQPQNIPRYTQPKRPQGRRSGASKTRSVKARLDAAQKLIEARAVARTHKNLACYRKTTNSFAVSEVISPVA
jgi:hypothetical protein